MASNIISPADINLALNGENPPIGHPLSAAEIGERLAPHRRGRYPGQAFTRAAISLYKNKPEQQSADFIEAWRSWIAAEVLRQDRLRVRMNGMTADEMLAETGYIQQLGEDPVHALIAVGQLPAGTLLRVNGTAAAVECAAEIATCSCGQLFVRRAWNHARCLRCRQAARRNNKREVPNVS